MAHCRAQHELTQPNRIPNTHTSVSRTLLYFSASPIAAAPSSPILLSLSLCSRGSIKKVRIPRAPKRRRGNGLSPHTHASVSRTLLYLSTSLIAAAPSLPMLLPASLCSRGSIKQVRIPRAPKRRRGNGPFPVHSRKRCEGLVVFKRLSNRSRTHIINSISVNSAR